jgi:hypothetical protein
MHISKLCFVVFCFVPNSGFAIQMRWDEDFLPREPENVYARARIKRREGCPQPQHQLIDSVKGERSYSFETTSRFSLLLLRDTSSASGPVWPNGPLAYRAANA